MKILLRVMLCMLTLATNLAPAQTISVVTEASPLFVHEQNGKVAGTATEAVELVLQSAGLTDHRINIYPWARAYNLALHQPNVLIYLLARTPEREPLFKWVGQVATVQIHLYKLKERKDIAVRSLADARQYTIGVLRDEVRHQYLRAQDFTKLELSSQHIDNLRKLEHHRIDMFPMAEDGMMILCRKFGYDYAKLEKVYTLDALDVKLYMAYSKGTTDDIVERTKAALASLRADGTLSRIMRKAP